MENSSATLQTFALWAGVLITIIGAIATPIIRSLLRENDRLAKDLENAELRIKENTALAVDSVNRAVKEAKEAHTEKRAEDIKRIERLERNYDVNNEMEPRKRP